MAELIDIYPVTDFARNARGFAKRLKKSGKAEVLTIEGRGEVVIQSVSAYQQLLERAELAESLAGIQRGLEDFKAGRHRPVEEFFKAFAAKHGIELG